MAINKDTPRSMQPARQVYYTGECMQMMSRSADLSQVCAGAPGCRTAHLALLRHWCPGLWIKRPAGGTVSASGAQGHLGAQEVFYEEEQQQYSL
jgi:hypothetical protein